MSVRRKRLRAAALHASCALYYTARYAPGVLQSLLAKGERAAPLLDTPAYGSISRREIEP